MSQLRRFDALYARYSEFTMVPQSWFRENLAVAYAFINSDVVGDIVECGTWRGGMLGALGELFGDRQRVGFDSFEGLPPATEVDGPAALEWQSGPGGRNIDNCAASEADCRRAMTLAGSPARIERGWFEDTVPRYASERRPIALLRLDGDWYDSTMTCLEHLYPLVAHNGIVLVDDYYVWDGCTRAVHDYLSRTQSSARIRSGPNGVCRIRKR